jgi:CheY-like chemotaxis protein
MNAYDVLVIGPEGLGREILEQTLRRLGHSVVAAQPPEGRELAQSDDHDVVVVDARHPEVDVEVLPVLGVPEAQPLLVVSDQPHVLMGPLGRRAAGAMVLTGAESDPAYRIAISVCAALRRARKSYIGQIVA